MPALPVLTAVVVGVALLSPLATDDSGAQDLGPVQLLSEAAAAEIAADTGQPVEVSALTSSTTKVTALPEGGFRAELSVLPARVKNDSTGSWDDVDTTVVVRPDGSIGPKVAATHVSFSRGGDEPFVQIANADRSVAMSWPEPLPAPRLIGSTAVYDVAPGVDLVAKAGATGFRSYVVVEDEQAGEHPLVRDLTFEVDTTGLQLADTAAGELEAKDDAETIFAGAQPLGWGSAPTTGSGAEGMTAEEDAVGAPLTAPAAADPTVLEVEASNSEISVDPAPVLDDPDTVYPAVVDPALDDVHSHKTHWAMAWSNGIDMYDSSSEEARVGYDGWADNKKSRVWYEYDISPLNGKAVTKAAFVHRLIHSPNTNCDLTTYGPAVEVRRSYGISGATTWSNQPALYPWAGDSNNTAHGNSTNCPGGTRQEWNIFEPISNAASANDDEITLRMKSVDETDRNGWRKYATGPNYPVLEVEYYNYPAAPTSLSIENTITLSDGSKWLRTLTPTLFADVNDNANSGSGNAYARFKITNLDTGNVAYEVTSPGVPWSGGTASVTVPSGELYENFNYKLEAWAMSTTSTETMSKTAKSMTFTIDKTGPAKPDVKQDTETCFIGKACKFTISKGKKSDGTYDTDVKNFKWGFNVDSPATTTASAAATQVSFSPDTFGPSWLTVIAYDQVGNASSKRVPTFKVEGTAMTHRWEMDSSAGTDSSAWIDPAKTDPAKDNLAAPLTGSGGNYTGDGVYGKNWDGNPLDPTDKAYTVDGDDYATTAGTPTKFWTDQDFTVSAWVKLSDLTPGQARVAVSQSDGSSPAFTLGHDGAGNWRFAVANSGGSAQVLVDDGDPLNQWVHLVGMYDNNTDGTEAEGEQTGVKKIRLYVNGVLAGEASAPAGVRLADGADGQVLIGKAYGTTTPRWWKGSIDSVRLYPGILDYSQVRQVYAERRAQP